MTLKKNNKFYRFVSAFLCMMISLFCFGCTKTPDNGSSSGSGGKKVNNDPFVTAVEIVSNPDKTNYFAGEKFSPRGLKFNATWNIDGETEVIDMTYSDCEGYTHKGESLTKDIKKITFTIGGYNFDVEINVTELDFSELKVVGDCVDSDCFVGTVYDLTKIKVYALKSGTNADEISLDDCTFTEDGKVVENATEYVVTKGTHQFSIAFAGQTVSFYIKGYEKSDIVDMNVKSISVDVSGLKTVYGTGELINFNKLNVTAVFTDETGKVNLASKVENGYTVKDNGVTVADPSAHKLDAGERTITVEYKGASVNFTISVKSYDELKVFRRDGSEEMKIGENADFDKNFIVEASVKGTDSKVTLNYGEYTLSDSENGSDIDSSLIFGNAGQKTVWVRYGNLKKSFIITVDATKYTLTISGVTMVGGNTLSLAFGSSLPEELSDVAGWYNAEDPNEFYLSSSELSGVKSNAKEFTMPARNLTLAPLNFVAVRTDPRTGAADYFVKENSDEYLESAYGKLSDTRTLYKINSTTVKPTDNYGYVLMAANGAWATEKGGISGAGYFSTDRIFTRTFTNYGNETVTFAYRHEHYNARYYQSEMIELKPGETYTYVYLVHQKWLSEKISNSTISFELYFGNSQIDYETILVHTAKAATLTTVTTAN